MAGDSLAALVTHCCTDWMQEVEHKEGELHKIGMPRSEVILMPKRDGHD